MSTAHTPTPEQEDFAKHASGVFVSACPGSGKTRAILDRLEILIKDLPLRRGICVLSFTQSAVEEFRSRLRNRGLSRILSHPHFVGTFDAFVRQFLVAPTGVAARKGTVRPHFVDCWENLSCRVQVKGIKGIGPFLDSFDPETGLLELDRVGDGIARATAAKAKEKFEQAAKKQRKFLNEQGYLSAADARLEALRKIRDERIGPPVGRAIAARFLEVIVDEGQDCNPQDVEILRWLRRCGTRVTLLADPDQSIYGFRYGNPETLHTLAQEYEPKDRLRFTGNFRCSQAICAIAATLRGPDKGRPDEPLGESRAVNTPVKLLAYEGQKPTGAIGKRFAEILSEVKIQPHKSMTLAHDWNSARRATGNSSVDEEPGASRVKTMARAVATYRSAGTPPRQRLMAIETVERVILQLCGKIGREEPLTHAIEARRVERRILRRRAVALASSLSPVIEQSSAENAAWVQQLQASTARLGLEMAKGESPRNFFRAPKGTKWSSALRTHEQLPLKASSIHEAKGRQHKAVCLVIPHKSERTEELITAWENRTELEAKRVIYVGLTRAEELLVLAVPMAYASRIESILCAADVPFGPLEFVGNPAREKAAKRRVPKLTANPRQGGLFT
jgi:superfamily I DNA/RNA helicase